jgi:hypothetical protein
MSDTTEAETRAVQEAIARGLDFLQRSQRHSGAFAVYRSSDPALEKNCVDDPSLFPAALIAYSLGFSDSPIARQIVDRAVALFTSEMEGPGIWRYWTREHPHYPNIPPDLDDIACISLVLKRHGAWCPDNRALILANRSRAGLFYTWLAPRLCPVVSKDFWTTTLRQLLRPIPFFLFWILFSARPRDIDAVVNANVLFYLGENPAARSVVDFLTATLKRGDEAISDKWHRNRFMFYYAVSRNCGSGIHGLDEARDLIVDRVVAALAGAPGEIRALDTALAACALMNCRGDRPELARTVATLTATQHANGAWPALPLYWGGPAGSPGYGSEELTTALCLEALVRYSATQPSCTNVSDCAS